MYLIYAKALTGSAAVVYAHFDRKPDKVSAESSCPLVPTSTSRDLYSSSFHRLHINSELLLVQAETSWIPSLLQPGWGRSVQSFLSLYAIFVSRSIELVNYRACQLGEQVQPQPGSRYAHQPRRMSCPKKQQGATVTARQRLKSVRAQSGNVK